MYIPALILFDTNSCGFSTNLKYIADMSFRLLSLSSDVSNLILATMLHLWIRCFAMFTLLDGFKQAVNSVEKFEEIYINIGSLQTPKQVRIAPSTK